MKYMRSPKHRIAKLAKTARCQPIQNMANQRVAAIAPKKLRVQTAVRHAWPKIFSVRSCRVAAITIETATRIGINHNRYSTDIAICVLRYSPAYTSFFYSYTETQPSRC